MHDRMTETGIFLGNHKLGIKIAKGLFDYQNPSLEQNLHGIHFKNPVGLSAGFDKDGKLTGILPAIGFGFAEIGSVTGRECAGNPKPRLWRLPEERSLVVHYGLKNEGCEKVAKRLAGKHFEIPIGASIAMTNCPENLDAEKAIKDYALAFRALEPFASYLAVNISCPNAEGGQPFSDPKFLDVLLSALDKEKRHCPVFLKLSPDISEEQTDGILACAEAHKVDGIICTNLTKRRMPISAGHRGMRGGLSGKAVEGLSNQMLSYVYRKAGKRFILIGSGGIWNAQDAYKKIRLGASLVEMITGMIFEGPQLISEINQELAELLKKDGFKNISEAVGVDNSISN